MKNTQKRLVGLLVVILILTLSATSVFAGATTKYPLLKHGSKGTAVIRLQKALVAQGYLKGKADGYYGLKTAAAVRKFQAAKKIKVDGKAGKVTLPLLYAKKSIATAKTAAAVTSRGTTTLSRAAATPTTSKAAEVDLYWLSRIIHAEAEAEPYQGKVAVGNVVLNRVKSTAFPNTVKGVIFEYYKGIPQFSPVADGTIYNTPCADSIKAAKAAIAGAKPVGTSTYFFNPDKSRGQWIVDNKTFVVKIGDHAFYK